MTLLSLGNVPNRARMAPGAKRKKVTGHATRVHLRERACRLAVTMILVVLVGCGDSRESRSPTRPMLTTQPAGVAFTGTIYPRRYNTLRDRAQGHHAIVWKQGQNASKALIEANVSDVAIQDQLESLGLEPASNLSAKAWTQRHDPSSPYPDERVEGPRLNVSILWEGADQAYNLVELLREEDPAALDIRFGGHRAYIDKWQSGCVTCLFSCPGGRTSNAAWTIRDQVRGVHPFHANERRLPPDGTPVEVTISAADEDRRPETAPSRVNNKPVSPVVNE